MFKMIFESVDLRSMAKHGIELFLELFMFSMCNQVDIRQRIVFHSQSTLACGLNVYRKCGVMCPYPRSGKNTIVFRGGELGIFCRRRGIPGGRSPTSPLCSVLVSWCEVCYSIHVCRYSVACKAFRISFDRPLCIARSVSLCSMRYCCIWLEMLMPRRLFSKRF